METIVIIAVAILMFGYVHVVEILKLKRKVKDLEKEIRLRDLRL